MLLQIVEYVTYIELGVLNATIVSRIQWRTVNLSYITSTQ
jgi:hypothetical protein